MNIKREQLGWKIISAIIKTAGEMTSGWWSVVKSVPYMVQEYC